MACLVSTLDLAVVSFGTVDLASLGHLIEAALSVGTGLLRVVRVVGGTLCHVENYGCILQRFMNTLTKAASDLEAI